MTDTPAPKLAPWKPPAVSASSPSPAPAPLSLTEAAWQRARYFENLAELQFAHIKALIAAVNRTGTAAPTTPHFPVLQGPAGDFNPNDR